MVAIVAADDAAWRRRAAIQEAAAAELLPEEAVDLDLPADPSVLDDLEPAEANVALQKPRAVPASRLDAVGRKSKPRPKQPDWRRKFREEIVKLRGEAVTLSATVENLKAAVRDRSEVLDKPGRGPPSAAMLWKRIAARQLTCRAQLESENVRLKADVKQRQKEMRELRRMLLKRANIQAIRELLGSGLSSLLSSAPAVGDADDDAMVFGALRGELDAIYADVGRVFSSRGVEELRSPDRKIHTQTRSNGQVVWEFVDVHSVPFALEATARALWLASGKRGWQDQLAVSTRHTELSECETISRVCFQVAISCLKITVLTRKVTKKFVEHDRIVFVTHSLHQPVFNGRLSSRAAVFREVDRIVVKAGANRQCGDPSSDIRRHILATTGDITSIATEGPDWKAADHHTAGVKTWTWAITRDNESIENVLLQGYCC